MTSPTHGAMTGMCEFVTFRVNEQWLGVPVLLVQEVLLSQRLAVVPLAPAAVAGFLNLRGQIVTAVYQLPNLALPPTSGLLILIAAYIVIIGHRGGYQTVYGHLLPVRKVRAGKVVRRGKVIGLMGSTGNSTGPHLHWEVRRGATALDPRRF